MVHPNWTQPTGRYLIVSGVDAIATDVPDVSYILEEKIRRQSKCAVIGKWKVAKSFFAIQMGMSIAAGEEFLSFKTTPSNVLYLNFEISPEKFQQRVQDMHSVLKYSVNRFKYLTITDLSLDVNTSALEAILTQCMVEGFPVELLIIDPRMKAITRDSNQDEVLRAFCVNLDKVMGLYRLAVVVVHHEGVATGADRAGKGSTVFEAWLDGWFRIRPKGMIPEVRDIDIWSRDSERQQIVAKFVYPIHEVAPDLVAEKKARTQQAKQCIVSVLQGLALPEQEVRNQVLRAGHSEYAFWRARKELVNEGRLFVFKVPGQQGNRKLMQLVP